MKMNLIDSIFKCIVSELCLVWVEITSMNSNTSYYLVYKRLHRLKYHSGTWTAKHKHLSVFMSVCLDNPSGQNILFHREQYMSARFQTMNRVFPSCLLFVWLTVCSVNTIGCVAVILNFVIRYFQNQHISNVVELWQRIVAQGFLEFDFNEVGKYSYTWQRNEVLLKRNYVYHLAPSRIWIIDDFKSHYSRNFSI